MSMSAGSVTVNADGTWSGTGMAKAIMDAYQPATIAGYTNPTALTTLNVSNFCAQLANSLATALVTYITTNAKAHVSTQSLGAMPASTTAGTPIAAPALPVDIPIQ